MIGECIQNHNAFNLTTPMMGQWKGGAIASDQGLRNIRTVGWTFWLWDASDFR